MIRFDFTTPNDDKKISVVEWGEVDNPKEVIQISHGMAEHAMRYDGFAKQMNKNGYVVFADDHRAHGHTDLKTLGYAKGNIFKDTLADLGALTEFYKNKNNLPVIFFGHSYGSFLGQRYVQEYAHLISGAIIGGSSYMGTPLSLAGLAVANIACAFGFAKKEGTLLKKLTFDNYNKMFEVGSFISSKKSECDRYDADELCGFICSYNFYKSFFKGLREIYKKDNMQKLDKGLNVLLISGKCDPVGEMSKGVVRLEKEYKEYGVNVKTVLYDGVRHEYLNDISRKKAIGDIVNFANSIIK